MAVPFTLTLTDEADNEVRQQILAPLVAYNDSRAGPGGHRPLVVTLRDEAGDIVGGLWGMTGYDWLFVQLLVVPEAQRGTGIGTRLMRAAEAEAAARGCHGAWLDTFEFQARPFYERLGYEVFANLPEYPRGSSRLFLRKSLTSSTLALRAPLAARHVGVGVGVLVVREGQVLLGRRKGSHGAGSWSLPGGRMEFGESIEACARRELLEETGLELGPITHGPSTSDVFDDVKEHYLTAFVVAGATQGEPINAEPHKCDGWSWFAWQHLPEPLFAPVASLRAMGFCLPT